MLKVKFPDAISTNLLPQLADLPQLTSFYPVKTDKFKP